MDFFFHYFILFEGFEGLKINLEVKSIVIKIIIKMKLIWILEFWKKMILEF
jgi:hypothetical protein